MEVASHLQKISNRFTLLNFQRYLIGSPLKGNIGGFYGSQTGGFSYINDIGYSFTLNPELIQNKSLLTVELARNYMHDSIHAATFRSFKMDHQDVSGESKIYRYQYGFNFRNQVGNSYSSISSTEKSPLAINLNILMDCVNQIFLSQQFNSILKSLSIQTLNQLEFEILNEIQGQLYCKNLFLEPLSFYSEVIDPSKRFLEFWDDGTLLPEIL